MNRGYPGPVLTPQQEAFELYHKAIEEDSKTSILGGPVLPALGHAVSGSVGSAISTVLTYPLSLVVTRLQVQRQFRNPDAEHDDEEYESLIDAVRKIYAEEGGISAFYSGCAQDTAKTVLDSFLFFLAYNYIRQNRLNSYGKKRLPIHEELGVGMVAGAFSRLLTTPVQQIVTRKQTAAMIASRSKSSAPTLSAMDMARQIRDEKGLLGFWSGYSASLILTTNPALTFLFHETLLRMFIRREQRSDPGSRKTFIIAALSKALASTITYPFSLAKARAQVSSKAPTGSQTEKVTEKDSVSNASRKTARNVERRTIFGTLIQIAREEGYQGLYQGLSGEVMKGFFSHGVTMLSKEWIHKVVIRVYYLILKTLKKYPSPEAMAKTAAEKVSTTASNIGDKMVEVAKDGAGATQKAAEDLSDKGQEALDRTTRLMWDLYHQGKEKSMDIVDEYMDTDDD